MDCTIPGSSVHVIFQAMVLEWVATSISRGSSQPGDRILVSHIAGRHFTVWATREALLTVWITTKCGKFLKRREYWTIYPYAGQETTVRTLHRTTDWLKIRKGEKLGCILSLYLSNFFAEFNVLFVTLAGSHHGDQFPCVCCLAPAILVFPEMLSIQIIWSLSWVPKSLQGISAFASARHLRRLPTISI